MSDNLQPNLPTARRDILKFAQSMLPPSLLRAIKILLTPCCSVVATAVATCSGKGSTYNITITLSSGVNLAGVGVAILSFSSNATSVSTAYSDNSTTITFTDVAIFSAGTQTVNLQLLMPTSYAVITPATSSSVLGYSIPQIPIVYPTC